MFHVWLWCFPRFLHDFIRFWLKVLANPNSYGQWAARCPAAPNSLLPLEQSWWRSMVFRGAPKEDQPRFIYIDLSSTKPNINKHTANNSWASAIVLLSSIMGTNMGSCHVHRHQEAITLGPKSTELAVRAFGCPFGLRKTSTSSSQEGWKT